MATQKTLPTTRNVEDFLNEVEDPKRRKDCFTITELMSKITHAEPKMWGTAIVGFGSYHYKYESGREGDAPLVGFSPRKQNLTLYVMLGSGEMDGELQKLGKFKTGKGCLYIDKLEDVNINVLQEIIKKAANYIKNKYN